MDMMMLCFRDLVTEPGGSVARHNKISAASTYTWWGWWKKPIEIVPNELLKVMNKRIADEGATDILLFDCGQHRIYSAKCSGLHVAPLEGGSFSPKVDKTPEYYAHIKCALWLKLTTIQEQQGGAAYLSHLTYASFPSWPRAYNRSMIGKTVSSFEQLDKMTVTMWHLRMAVKSGKHRGTSRSGKSPKQESHVDTHRSASNRMALAGIDTHDLICRVAFL